jgi:hypothetical protein
VFERGVWWEEKGRVEEEGRGERVKGERVKRGRMVRGK